MPVADIVIAVAIVVSVVIGFVRGFVKEAISIAALLIAIWAAMHFGRQAGSLSESWLSSSELQVWFGRLLVFTVILVLGGLIGWGVTKLVRLSILSGTDRVFGMAFGFCRGVVLLAVFIIGGEYANFNNDPWWQKSTLIPYGEVVADWIRVMAPRGADMLLPGGAIDEAVTELRDSP
jgi:membrane protein required for colicin V production